MSTEFVDIAIIGAGPGGLALAQGLKKHGIEVAVFEKDAVRADYVQGFRLRMHQRGLDALQANLPPHLFAAFEATTGLAPATSLTVDEALHPLADTGPARDQAHIDKSVSRITLRQVLLGGLDDIVHYGKRFAGYEVEPEGTVLVRFADGTRLRTRLLVGADGAGSAVRGQLLPAYRLVDTGKRRLAGKLSLAAAEKYGIPALLLDNNVAVRPRHGGRGMMITAHRVDPAAFARFGLIGQDDPGHAGHQGLHFDNTASYVWWNTAYEEGELGSDAALEQLDGAGLIEALLGRIGHWHEALVKLVRHS
ncbi:MAG TPA: FAD-dependent monooxygenase, partial [Novosphingobium sp.]|nr:FAD-dependent monooxygenase [Novosphingobium sp.]